MGAADTQCLVQLGSHLARLSRFQWFYETAASRSGARNADAWLTPCSPFTLPRFLRHGGLTPRRDGLAHTLLASHVSNGSRRRLPHAQARWVPMAAASRLGAMVADDTQCLVQLSSHLARLSRFQWFQETAASHSGAMGAADIQCLVQFGSHLARLSRFQWLFEKAASRSGAMGADDIQCLVQLGSHLARLSRFQ
eukprot:scaffold68569_cov35-Phaeocystis_antarctica.AAC.1